MIDVGNSTPFYVPHIHNLLLVTGRRPYYRCNVCGHTIPLRRHVYVDDPKGRCTICQVAVDNKEMHW